MSDLSSGSHLHTRQLGSDSDLYALLLQVLMALHVKHWLHKLIKSDSPVTVLLP